LKSMFGTMCKPLHAGKAAQNGLLAAMLAARGFSSRTDALECAQGFAATQSSDFRPERALADPPGSYHLRGNLFKYHPACYLTHAPVECARKLRREHAIDPAAVRQALLKVDVGASKVCHILAPRTGLEANVLGLAEPLLAARAPALVAAVASLDERAPLRELTRLCTPARPEPISMPEFVRRAVPKPKGNCYEDSGIRRRFEHHWGPT